MFTGGMDLILTHGPYVGTGELHFEAHGRSRPDPRAPALGSSSPTAPAAAGHLEAKAGEPKSEKRNGLEAGSSCRQIG